MYKKITHTIVEEHFDHPMGVGIAANVGLPKVGRHSLADVMPIIPVLFFLLAFVWQASVGFK